jgi:hypothetical protein
MRMHTWSWQALFSAGLLLLSGSPAWSASFHVEFLKCNEPTGILCAEQRDNPGGNEYYVGHDEPSLLFYSDVPGAGFNNTYRIRLPKDPPMLPKQDGSGGTWNFQLHPAFWFGMAMCDDQGNPNPGGAPGRPNIPCTADSDSNIFDSPDPTAKDYIGNHPGTAFMEMQFYPPGWINSNSGFIDAESATKWTAALNIDSFQSNDNTGQGNNAACVNITNGEYVNFAFIQTDGVPSASPSPYDLNINTTNAKTLRMDGGDELIVTLADTASGLSVTIHDLTSGASGSMVASRANGFASVLWDPAGKDCDRATHELKHNFHPAYATSSEHTRVPGAAHSYNIAFSDEIGHFEYCSSVAQEFGACTSTTGSDKKPGPPALPDDLACIDPGFAAAFGLLHLGGCFDSDTDFDGVPYRNNTWPGSFKNPAEDALFHAEPVIFSSPLLTDSAGRKENFSRVAFEVDLPRIEFGTTPPCQRHLSNPADPHPGHGCVNPPKGASFYPFYSTRLDAHGCQWQEGGPFIPGTLDDFGGSSAAEFGPILANFYPAVNGQPQYILENFHRTLPINPCPTF